MPPGLPAPLELVELSGAFEVGIGVAAPPLRRAIARATIALLVAVFPGNRYIAFENVPLGNRAEGLGALNYVRLPFQALLIGWAWIYTRRRPRDEAR